jgi:hypothetical protein
MTLSISFILTENRNLTDDGEIEKALRFGEYIKNGELEVVQNYLLQLIKRARNPCLVLAPQVSTPEADVSFKLYIRYLTDYYHRGRTLLASAEFIPFMTADLEEESGGIVRLCEAHAYEKVQTVPH